MTDETLAPDATPDSDKPVTEGHSYFAGHLMTLPRFLGLLPQLRPRVTVQWIQMMRDMAQKDPSYLTAQIRAAGDAPRHLRECMVPDWSATKITPEAAGWFIKLLQDGLLPPTLFKKPSPIEHPLMGTEAAWRYVTSGPALRERAKAFKSQTFDASNLDAVREEDFTWSLLNSAFMAARGPGSGTLKIGGIEVTKSLAAYSSNSGKSRDFSVTFNWTSSAGEAKTLHKPSSFEGNRRNDAERNWGLGRE